MPYTEFTADSLHGLIEEQAKTPPPVPDVGHGFELQHPGIGRMSIVRADLPGVRVVELRFDPQQHLRMREMEGEPDLVQMNFQLEGYLQSHFTGLVEPLKVQRGNHVFGYMPESGSVHQLEKGRQQHILHLMFQADHLMSLLDENDEWSMGLAERMARREPYFAAPGRLKMDPQMAATIHGLLNSPLKGAMRRIHMQGKVLELLALQMDEIRRGTETGFHLPPDVSRADAEKLHALKAHLDLTYLEEQTLERLARLFGLNVFKLKKGFKLLFKATVFGYLQRLRMEHARVLLENGVCNVNEAADMLGYQNPNHFTTAFKRYFGHPPGVLRWR